MVERIGREISSAAYWAEQNREYAGAIENEYHAHRLAMIRSLIPSTTGGTVLDFGAGDGVMLLDFPNSKIIGIEPDEQLVAIARDKVPAAEFIQGGVESLATLGDESVDLLLCLNVAAYFTDAEDDLFYRETGRVLRPGAALVITHSNELFDLFSLNAFTVEFFRDNFSADPSPLLARPDQPQRATYNIRENPLAYRHKLARYGLTEQAQAFSNHHRVPPLLDSGQKDYPDTLDVPEDERWKLMFTCSTFGSRSVKLR